MCINMCTDKGIGLCRCTCTCIGVYIGVLIRICAYTYVYTVDAYACISPRCSKCQNKEQSFTQQFQTHPTVVICLVLEPWRALNREPRSRPMDKVAESVASAALEACSRAMSMASPCAWDELQPKRMRVVWVVCNGLAGY